MIFKIKNYLKNNSEKFYLGILLLVSLGARIFYSFLDSVLWWDEAVYIGMGKYLATFGQIGFWEFFRPPLFPIFYAFIYKLNLHLPLILFGKSVILIASTVLIYLVYVISERIKKGTGLWAGLFLSMTPVFFYFSKNALSDIISSFFGVLALYFFINKKDFFSGIFVGIAFLLRFPQGLVLVPILISLLYREYEGWDGYFKRIIYSGVKILFGFSILLIPYLISNYLFYGSFFEPLQYANNIILNYSFLYFKGFWYYINEFWNTAPFLFLSIFSIFVIFSKFHKKLPKDVPLVSVFITAFIFCSYFFFQPHKELRYGLAFLPYLAILSGLGVGWIFEKTARYKNIVKIIFVIGVLVFLSQAKSYIFIDPVNPHKDFYAYFSNKEGMYISTTPVPVVFGKIRILQLLENKDSFVDFLTRNPANVKGVVVNSCDIFCEDRLMGGSCEKDVAFIYKKLGENFKQVYNQNIDKCNFSVFEK